MYGFPRLGALGRLGNQLWQVAATVARSRRSLGSRAQVNADWEYRPYLSLPEELYATASPGDQRIDVADEPGGPFFQQLEHVAEVYNDLRDWYAPSDRAWLELRRRFRPLLGQHGHRTAVHVRRTDYLDHPDRFPQMTPRYYQAATDRVAADHQTTFLVFSDDIPWCRENPEALGLLGSRKPHAYIEGHVRPINPRERTTEPTDVYDLLLMATCDAHIIANSTFSWWGAFLSRQDLVVYPDRWFGDERLHATMWDCIPDGWEQLPC